jgi:hypothetical protein
MPQRSTPPVSTRVRRSPAQLLEALEIGGRGWPLKAIYSAADESSLQALRKGRGEVDTCRRKGASTPSIRYCVLVNRRSASCLRG